MIVKMKKYLLYTMLLAGSVMGFTSCSEDKMSDTSVIVGQNARENAFDKWLQNNYVEPYNIEIQYRYNDNESDMQYYDIPADLSQSIELAHIVKYSCVDAYTRVGGFEFTCTYFPKLFTFYGEFEYEKNGAFKLGTAEGGKKIRLLGVNHLNEYISNLTYLNEYYLKTIHHEFVHIVNQTKDYPREFDEITPKGYVNDSWSSSNYVNGYLQRGFITNYSQKEAREDFAEMVSTYVITSAEDWEKMMAAAVVTDDNGKKDTSARQALEKKLEICKRYYLDTFGIDLDQLRDEVVRRESDIINGYVNLYDLSIDNK